METTEVELGKFELGFDHEILIKEKRIAGISPESAAYEAGLRENQKVVGRSIYYDNPNQPAEIHIEENGERRKIIYLPATRRKINVPQFRVRKNLTAGQNAGCLSRF